jgi:hypothetical protein
VVGRGVRQRLGRTPESVRLRAHGVAERLADGWP